MSRPAAFLAALITPLRHTRVALPVGPLLRGLVAGAMAAHLTMPATVRADVVAPPAGRALPVRDVAATLGATALPAADVADSRTFPQTGYRIDQDSFWNFFQRRGGVRTFGYPVSQPFPFLGCLSQFFQRAVLQQCSALGVSTLNLLGDGLLPYTRINGSTFPADDPAVIAQAPAPGDPQYAAQALEFIRATVPDTFEGEPVNFYRTFQNTITLADAYPDGDGDPSLLPLLNLELWGLPVSVPQRDPNNAAFVYQRFQRGIMHFDQNCGCTQGLLLADYLKAVITGQGLPADLEAQARSNPLYRSLRASPPPGTDFSAAFAGGAVPVAALTPAQPATPQPTSDGSSPAAVPAGSGTAGSAAGLPSPEAQSGWAPGPQATGGLRLRGSVDAGPGASVAQGASLHLSGWIANLDDPTPPGIVDVQVYDGGDSAGRRLATASLGGRRPDVAQTLALPALAASGFEADVSTAAFPLGDHTLTIAARTRTNGVWLRLLTFSVTAPGPRPAGQFLYGAVLANPTANAKSARAAGLGLMSAYVPWRNVEPSRGTYLFKQQTSWGDPVANDLTNVLNAAKGAGLKLVFRLDGPPDWSGGQVYRLNPADVEDYVYQVVSYGKGTIAFVEVFNELNLPFEWGTSPVDPAGYARILAAAYRGAKRADPGVQVISAAVSQRTGGGGGSMEDVDWLAGLYQAGAKDSFDLLGMHAYLGNFPADADPSCLPMCFRTIELYRAVMEQYGDAGKRAFITEMGTLEQTSVNLNGYNWMELPSDQRADNLVKALQLANARYPWLLGAMVFNLDYATVPWNTSTSPMYWFSLLNADRSPRPAYNRLKDARANGTLP